jgi:hypothetical protein
MKKNLILSTLLLSSFAYADVDYSRCLMAANLYGPTIDNDGKFSPGPYQKLKSMKTEGKKETYVIEGNGYPYNMASEVTLERDDQGRVIKISNGSDKLEC